TKIEWYTEVGPTHGIVGVSIDGGPEVMVDLYAAAFNQMVKVWELDTLAPSERTIKLRCTGTKNALSSNAYLITDLFKIFKPLDVPDVPIEPPITPPTGEIIVQPGQSIKSAVENATAGKTIRLLEGTYTENIINVPIGVNVIGPGKDKTFINYTGSVQPQSSTAMFQINSATKASGNQTISGFTIRGVNACNGGIHLSNRDNVKLLDVRVQETTFFGVWLKDTIGSEFANSELINSSWASVGWASGELCVYNLTNTLVHHNLFKTTRTDKGYGIKSLGGVGEIRTSKFYSNKFELAKRSIWNNNSPNIDFELHDCYYAGFEIYDNDFGNMLSLAGNKPTRAGKVIARNNRFKMGGGPFAIEIVCSDILLDANTITETSILTACFSPGKWINQVVNNNDFVSNNANPSWGGTFLVGPGGSNMLITNNRLKKGNYPLIKYHNSTPAMSTIIESGNTIT
ncbi:MAG TPA: hypothetical protein VK589_16575, partial [Chryseolinea sp.]|nr:hypothetical protein [Chryseolinea sp.]